MKRIDALKLIANQLDFLAGTFEGVRTEFSSKELSNADVILTTLEHAGILPPANGKLTTNFIDMGVMPDHSWEPENE